MVSIAGPGPGPLETFLKPRTTAPVPPGRRSLAHGNQNREQSLLKKDLPAHDAIQVSEAAPSAPTEMCPLAAC
jgi:hypothetical protein